MLFFPAIICRQIPQNIVNLLLVPRIILLRRLCSYLASSTMSKFCILSSHIDSHTDKKENQIFLINKEIQKG